VIDLHSHLLPGVDDGSRSAEQSVAVLEAFAEAGVEAVVLTPHVTASDINDHGADVLEQRAEVFEGLKAAVRRSPTLHLGFEIMLDERLSDRALGDRRYALAQSRYALVEFPLSVSPDGVAERLSAIGASGVVPLVAHPERYFRCAVRDLSAWRSAGAKFQLDAITLTRANLRGHQARALLRAGLADVVAADNHGSVNRTIGTAVQFLSERGHADAARRLAAENPRAVIEDRDLIEVGAVGVGSRAGDFVRRMVTSRR
jgi:protein-tyrosine phosphatase